MKKLLLLLALCASVVFATPGMAEDKPAAAPADAAATAAAPAAPAAAAPVPNKGDTA